MNYEPKNINDIVYHSARERKVINDIATGAVQFPVSGKNGILLHGIYGTGKTTLARMLPKAIERGKGGADVWYEFCPCEQGQNGAALMTKLRNMASYSSFNTSGYHYFVLDEVDNLTDAAVASMKTVMDIPQTVFIMTTNNIGKIDGGVKNRCVRVDFNAAPAADWLPLAQRVLNDCGKFDVSDDKLLPVIDACKGSVRDIVEAMQRIAA